MDSTAPEWIPGRPNDTLEPIDEPLDWKGPADKANPHNWPVVKKVFHSAIPAIYSFAL